MKDFLKVVVFNQKDSRCESFFIEFLASRYDAFKKAGLVEPPRTALAFTDFLHLGRLQ
jgi:hypothetical protein